MNQKTKKVLSCLLLLSCIISNTFQNVPDSDAAQKARLKTKKITLKTGKKKTIRIVQKRKKAAYRFKAAKKSIATVSRKGVVTARKPGRTKITVFERINKKTRKIGKVTVLVTANKASKRGTVSSVNTAPAQAQPTDALPTIPSVPAITLPPSVSQTPSVSTAEPSKTPAVSETPAPTTTIVYQNMFEDGDPRGFIARGSSSLEISNSENHSEGGKNSLLVNTRTATWHGTLMSLSSLTKTGETYDFEAWVKLGSAGTETLNMTLQYTDLDGNAQYKQVAAASVSNSDWIRLSGSYEIPYYKNNLEICLESPSSKTTDFLVDDITITGIPVNKVQFNMTDEIYQEMKISSFLSSGNNAKIKSVIERAKNGEDVTLAYIGGSITEGALAVPNSNCYAQTSANYFAEKYGTGENVHFVNAGMSGTPSSLGIVRYERDVIGQMQYAGWGNHPDILFIEFAVNDSGEVTDGGAYEGLIRTALASGSAVFLIFSVFQGDGLTPNTVYQSKYIPYGEYYDLPMISMGNALKTHYTEEGFQDWYFGDSLHPNNTGHRFMADCIMNVFDTINNEAAEADNIPDVDLFPAKKTTAYQNTKLMDASTDISGIDAISALDCGSFSSKDSSTCTYQYQYKGEKGASWFPDNWMHTTGSESFTATVNCKTLMILYKASNSTNYGSADLYIDGVKKKTLNCYESSGWNNAKVDVVFTNTTSATHTIELKMADGSESKSFTLLGLGYN